MADSPDEQWSIRWPVQVTDPQGRRNLGGNVNMRNLNLAMVNPVFSRGEKAAGMLNAELRLGGDVQSPQLFGQLQLSALDIDGNFMPFEMQPSQLTMNFSGTRSTLAGIVRTQQGQINLNGNADWSQIDNWRARVTAKGSRVRITVPPMVRWMSRRMWSLTRRLRCSRWMGVWTFRGRELWCTTCRRARSASPAMWLCSTMTCNQKRRRQRLFPSTVI